MNHYILTSVFVFAEIVTILIIIMRKMQSKFLILAPYLVTILCALIFYLIKDTAFLKHFIDNDALWLFSNISNLTFVMALLSTPLAFISMLIINKYRS